MDHFDFDKVAAAQFPREMGNADRFVGIARAGGVGEQGDGFGDIVEDVGQAALVCAAKRQCDNLRARLFNGSLDELQRIFAGTKDESGGKGMPSDGQKILLCIHGSSPFVVQMYCAMQLASCAAQSATRGAIRP